MYISEEKVKNFWSHLDLRFFAMFLFFNSWMGRLSNLYELQYVPLQNENNNIAGVKAGVQKLFCEEPVNTLGFASHKIYVATTQLYHLVQKQPQTICKWMRMTVSQ